MSKVASLADIPKSPHELEDYVAALFQSAHYFVEKNITERDITDILELDAVATSYEGANPSTVLAEAKSGRWGFPDIFKVIGWMRYLDIPRGAFFVSKDVPGKDSQAVQQKVGPFGLAFVHLGDFSDATSRFRAAGFPEVKDSLMMEIWRFSYWMERRLIDKLRVIAKSDPSKEGPREALEYHRLINDGIFFVKDVRDRLHQLYHAFQTHPKLSLGIASEMGGGPFDPDAVDPANPIIREAMLKGKHDQLQASFYAEHRARLAILKAAIDYECLVGAGSSPATTGVWIPVLPGSFELGLKALKGEPFFKRYPLFWQVFLWGFGGFYLEDRKDEEFKWLSEQTGIPPGEIPRALRAFDVLFPTQGSWLTSIGPSQCRIIKMVPTAFQGLGAYHRRRRYGFKEYKEFGYTDHTARDLGKWNNAGVDLLIS